MNTTQTPGQSLTDALRRYFSLGTRTRRYRNGRDLHAEMAEAIDLAAQYDGYYVERTQKALEGGVGAARSYAKHVGGYRISGTLALRINSMTAWQFAGLLGEMVDAGVTTTGAGERFFSEMSRAA
jgi:hypothetical protein